MRRHGPHRFYLLLSALGLLALLTRCGGGGGDVGPLPTPTAISVISGNQQTGRPGTALPAPLTVKVTSSNGAGVEGATVTFAAAGNSGSVSSSSSVTNSDGIASATWTLGTTAGAQADTAWASVSGVADPAVFMGTVVAGDVTALAPVSGNSQNGLPGQPLAQPLAVMAHDQFGNPTSHVSVSWTVNAGGGTISPASSITGTDGLATAIWTPGSGPTNTAQARAAGVDAPVSFSASVVATPSRLSAVSGNSQTGSPGQQLAQPLVVSLKTQAGTSIVGMSVTWVVTSGGGSVSPTVVPTDGQGRSSIIWTLGPNMGAQTATAAVGGADGSPITFTAVAVTPSSVVTLVSLSPTPLVEGQAATLTGTGFSPTPSSNAVQIGGESADVTGATATTLTVTVPRFNCQPARAVPIQVTVGSEGSNVVTQSVEPSAFTTVPVGQQLLLQDPAGFCLQFGPSISAEDYLIGIQSTSETVSSLTLATLTGVSAGPAVPPLAAQQTNLSPLASTSLPSAATEKREKRATAEAVIRQAERRLIRPERLIRRAPQANPRFYSIPSVVSVGDQLDVLVPDYVGGDPCRPVHVTATVRVIGSRGIWLEDTSNPSGGYTAADFQSLSDQLDTQIYDTDVSYFGAPTDLDANGRIGVLITKEVNRAEGLLGFVSATNLLLRTSCASSNEGEIFYGAAPDPTGTYALGAYPVEQARRDAPFLVAHELSHIIQTSRRLYVVNGPLMASWTAEGQATLAEEVVGFAVEGRASGQDLGFAVALNQDDPSSIDWFSDRFGDMARYYGFQSATSKVAGAPAECSWLAKKPANPGPCLGGRQIYGVPWSLLRWMTDRYAPSFSGGEAGLQKALIDTRSVGYDNLQTVVNVPIKSLLAQWAAALYVDDRVPAAVPELTIPSWNLFDILGANVAPSARLVPVSFGFGAVNERVAVRAGSTGYFRVSGTSHPATAIRVRDNSDGNLPSIMQLFVVRLQ